MNSFEAFVPKNESSLIARPFVRDRREMIAASDKSKQDVVIVGGGIVGVMCAWVCALQGFKVCLLERSDFGARTPPHSLLITSALLGAGDASSLGQSLDSIERFVQLDSTYVRPVDVLVDGCFKGVGGIAKILLSWFKGYTKLRREIRVKDFCCDNRRYLYDLVYSARYEGASLINHAEVISISHEEDSRVRVVWRNQFDGSRHELSGATLLNCAGSDAEAVGRLSVGSSSQSSDVSQIYGFIRNKELVTEAVCLGDKRVSLKLLPVTFGTYFECIFDGEYKRSQSCLDEEVVSCIKRFFPELSGAIKSSDVKVYASLASRDGFSGDYEWKLSQGTLTLKGANVQEARAIAHLGLVSIRKASSTKGFKIHDVTQRNLSGSAPLIEGEKCAIQAVFTATGVDQKIAERVIERYGRKALSFIEDKALCRTIGGLVLLGEILWAVDETGARTWEDLLVRRLGFVDVDYVSEAVKIEIAKVIQEYCDDKVALGGDWLHLIKGEEQLSQTAHRLQGV